MKTFDYSRLGASAQGPGWAGIGTEPVGGLAAPLGGAIMERAPMPDELNAPSDHLSGKGRKALDRSGDSDGFATTLWME